LGAGKTWIAAALAQRLAGRGTPCVGITADPGSPGFGVPGALALGVWRDGGWRVERLAALCALDAARYRLPLVQALGRLARAVAAGPLIVDTPGVVRGSVGAELLLEMAEAARADLVLAVLPAQGAEAEAARAALRALTVEVVSVPAAPEARRRTKAERAAARTRQWDRWLAAATDQVLDLGLLSVQGAAPSPGGWMGRQVALLDRQGATLAMGEVTGTSGGHLNARLVRLDPAPWAALLVRDAARSPRSLLRTAREPTRAVPAPGLPPELAAPDGAGADPACFVHLGSASALLVGGVFGDPLLHLRLRQRAQSLLFDLGDCGRLPARIAHQVSHVFLTHAHMDHIAGFLWLLRSRIGVTEPCRLYGPPGLAAHIAGFIAGVCWDRIGDQGPRFEVQELDGDRLRRFHIQAGGGLLAEGEQCVADGLLVADPGFSVRAVALDHGIPVLAFAFETAPTVHIRAERLAELGLAEGPWIGELKRGLLAGHEGVSIDLPKGRSALVGTLGAELAERRPARRLVYATDLADSPANRERLIALAAGTDVLICEAAFRTADVEQARRTGHLTARACGEIAAAAGVSRLIPFHFSRRYESDPAGVYDEVEAGLGRSLLRAVAS
jgi:ribonuclease BN (tRNA processing enzyme)